MLDELIIHEESVSANGQKVTITGTSYGKKFNITLCLDSLNTLEKRIAYLRRYMSRVSKIARELEKEDTIGPM